MSLLPGVPSMGPAPVKIGSGIPGAKQDVGQPTGIGKVAGSVGKPSNTEHLGSVVGRTGKGMTSVGGGSPLTHSLNHYGKTASPGSVAGQMLGGSQVEGGVVPTQHAGAKAIRGGSGGIGHRVRQGGLGNGKMGMPGPDQDVNTTEDTE